MDTISIIEKIEKMTSEVFNRSVLLMMNDLMNGMESIPNTRNMKTIKRSFIGTLCFDAVNFGEEINPMIFQSSCPLILKDWM